MNIKKWFVTIFTTKENNITTTLIGSRVNTPSGPGVVTGGCLHVKHDEAFKNHPNDRTISHEIQNISW